LKSECCRARIIRNANGRLKCVCVCVCVCVCACMCVLCECVCMCVLCVCTYIYMYVCVCVIVYVRMQYVCMHACMHVCMFVYTHTHTHGVEHRINLLPKVRQHSPVPLHKATCLLEVLKNKNQSPSIFTMQSHENLENFSVLHTHTQNTHTHNTHTHTHTLHTHTHLPCCQRSSCAVRPKSKPLP